MQHYKSESAMERDVIPDLKRLYGRNIWYYRNSYKTFQEIKGMPDWFFCFYGSFVAIEFKNGHTQAKPHEAMQNYIILRIRDANGFACVCRNKQSVLDTFRSIHDVIAKKELI